jgi:hypothetical protein
MSSHQAKIQESNAFIEKMQSTISNVQESSDVFSLTNIITNIQEELLSILWTVEVNTSIKAKINNVQALLQHKVNSMQGKINNLTTQIATLTTNRVAVEARIVTLNGNIPILQTALTLAQTTYDTATPPIASHIINNLNSARSALQTAQNELNNRQQELTQIDANLSNHQESLLKLNETIIGIHTRLNFMQWQYTTIATASNNFNTITPLVAQEMDPSAVWPQTINFNTYAWWAIGASNHFCSAPTASLQASIYNQEGNPAIAWWNLTGVSIEWASGTYTIQWILINPTTGVITYNNIRILDSAWVEYRRYPVKLKLQVWITQNLNTALIDTIPHRPLSLSNRKTLEITIRPPILTPVQRAHVYDTIHNPATTNNKLTLLYNSPGNLWYAHIQADMILWFAQSIHPSLYNQLKTGIEKQRFVSWFRSFLDDHGIVWFTCDTWTLHHNFRDYVLDQTRNFMWNENEYHHHMQTQINTHEKARYQTVIQQAMKNNATLYTPPNDRQIYDALSQYELQRMHNNIDGNDIRNHIHNHLAPVWWNKKNIHRWWIIGGRPVRWLSNLLRKKGRKNKLDSTKTSINSNPWTSFFEWNTYKSTWSYMDQTSTSPITFDIEAQFSIKNHSRVTIKTGNETIALWATENIPKLLETILYDARIAPKTRPHIALHMLKMIVQSWQDKIGHMEFGNNRIVLQNNMLQVQQCIWWTWTTIVDEAHIIDTANQDAWIDAIQNIRNTTHTIMSTYNNRIYKSLVKHKNSRVSSKKIKGNFNFKVWAHSFEYKDGTITTTVNGTKRKYTDLEYLLCHKDFFGSQIEIMKTLHQKMIEEAFKRPKTKRYNYYVYDTTSSKTYIIFDDGHIGEWIGPNPPRGHGRTPRALGWTRDEKVTQNYVLSNPKLMSTFFGMMK